MKNYKKMYCIKCGRSLKLLKYKISLCKYSEILYEIYNNVIISDKGNIIASNKSKWKYQDSFFYDENIIKKGYYIEYVLSCSANNNNNHDENKHCYYKIEKLNNNLITIIK